MKVKIRPERMQKPHKLSKPCFMLSHISTSLVCSHVTFRKWLGLAGMALQSTLSLLFYLTALHDHHSRLICKLKHISGRLINMLGLDMSLNIYIDIFLVLNNITNVQLHRHDVNPATSGPLNPLSGIHSFAYRGEIKSATGASSVLERFWPILPPRNGQTNDFELRWFPIQIVLRWYRLRLLGWIHKCNKPAHSQVFDSFLYNQHLQTRQNINGAALVYLLVKHAKRFHRWHVHALHPTHRPDFRLCSNSMNLRGVVQAYHNKWTNIRHCTPHQASPRIRNPSHFSCCDTIWTAKLLSRSNDVSNSYRTKF